MKKKVYVYLYIKHNDHYNDFLLLLLFSVADVAAGDVDVVEFQFQLNIQSNNDIFNLQQNIFSCHFFRCNTFTLNYLQSCFPIFFIDKMFIEFFFKIFLREHHFHMTNFENSFLTSKTLLEFLWITWLDNISLVLF